MTFYCADNVPGDSLTEDTLNVLPSLVYSTPFADNWRAYCDVMLHSLVVIDRTGNVGLIVYTYNRMTKSISGEFVEHWSEKERWCLGNLTLGSVAFGCKYDWPDLIQRRIRRHFRNTIFKN